MYKGLHGDCFHLKISGLSILYFLTSWQNDQRRPMKVFLSCQNDCSYRFVLGLWKIWLVWLSFRECCKEGSRLGSEMLTHTHLVLPCSRLLRSRWWNLVRIRKWGRKCQCKSTDKRWAYLGQGTLSCRHPLQVHRPWLGSLSLPVLLWTWWIYLETKLITAEHKLIIIID